MSGEDGLGRYIVRAGRLAELEAKGLKPRILEITGEIADAIAPVGLNNSYLAGVLCRLRRAISFDIGEFQTQAKRVLYDPDDFSKLELELRNSGLIAGGIRSATETRELFDLFGSRIIPFYELAGDMFEHGVNVVPYLVEAAAEAARCSSDMDSFLSEPVKPNRPEEMKARIFYRVYHRPGDDYAPTADELLTVSRTLYSLATSQAQPRAEAAVDLFRRLGEIHQDGSGLKLADSFLEDAIEALPRHLDAVRGRVGYVSRASKHERTMRHRGGSQGDSSIICTLGAGALLAAER